MADERRRTAAQARAVRTWKAVAVVSGLAAVAAGVTAGYALRRSAELDGQARALRSERAVLEQRLSRSEAELAGLRQGLDRIREAEARIREWLGLDGAGETQEVPAADARGGGQGSLGEVDLSAVAPEDRTAPNLGAAGDVGALADEFESLAARVQALRRSWDRTPAISPVDGEHWISSGFGWRRSPFTGRREFHNGLDMAGREGTPVVAVADGRVVRVVRDRRLGNAVAVDHGDGVETVYGHLGRVDVVKGQAVVRGQQLGGMGNTGRSTGPHVHYAVKVDGKFVNPRPYLVDRRQVPETVVRVLTEF